MILFVEDERNRLDSYLRELQLSGLQVTYVPFVDEAIETLEANPGSVELLILDVMMPWGKAFDEEETQQGLRTGLLFYQRVRDTNKELPVIVFTNVGDEALRKKFEQDPNCRFYEKGELLPFELADVVKEMLQANE